MNRKPLLAVFVIARMPVVVVLLLVGILPLCAAGVAPTAGELQTTSAWYASAFLDREVPPPMMCPGIELVCQDHGILGRNRSSRNTAPLRLADRSYQHGIGTHSTSELVVRLDEPGVAFSAEVGIDNNWDTRGVHGSVVFVVEIGGREVFRSDIRRGDSPILPVHVDLDGAMEFTLRVLDAEDGVSHDQADWAAAAVTLQSGRTVRLQDMPLVARPIDFSDALPFSFIYGGRPSGELLPRWTRTVSESTNERGEPIVVVAFTDPETGLEVSCESLRFADYPAVDWLLRFRNTGPQATPILEQVLPLDLRIQAARGEPVTLRYARGSRCRPDDFQPLEEPIEPGSSRAIAPVGGRSSNEWLPFFNLMCGAARGEGAIVAIGWSGQWQLRTDRADDGTVMLRGGQQTSRFSLQPGETVRTPRVLLIRWQDDPMRGHNVCRSLIYNHYTPLVAGRKPVPHTQCNSWFPVGDDGGLANEENQKQLLRAYAPLGIEFLVMDAGWYGVTPNWAENVGHWTPRLDTFPRGIRPVGDVSREVGLPFGMWFEPERVCPGTWLDTEHPDWCIRIHDGHRLLNLGLPAAQDWLIDMVSGYIADVPLGYFRLDFNMDPLPYWQSLDAPDRQGIAEIRYLEGLYRVLDTLRTRHPDVFFEGCSSGGRRIDIESLARCHTYWRSDLYFNSAANQQMIYGASLYLPGNYINTPMIELTEDPYPLRSTFGGAICLAWDPRPDTFNERLRRSLNSPWNAHAQYDHQDLDAPFDSALAKQQVETFKKFRPLALGDFHPLLPYATESNQWMGYQFHRDDLGQGMALFFRRGGPYASVQAALRGIDPDTIYRVTFIDTGLTREMPGRELAEPLTVEIAAPHGSAMIVYEFQK